MMFDEYLSALTALTPEQVERMTAEARRLATSMPIDVGSEDPGERQAFDNYNRAIARVNAFSARKVSPKQTKLWRTVNALGVDDEPARILKAAGEAILFRYVITAWDFETVIAPVRAAGLIPEDADGR